MREFEKTKAGNRYATNRRLAGTRRGRRDDGRYWTERTAQLTEKAFWKAITAGHGEDLLPAEKDETPKVVASKPQPREITVIYRRRKSVAA